MIARRMSIYVASVHKSTHAIENSIHEQPPRITTAWPETKASIGPKHDDPSVEIGSDTPESNWPNSLGPVLGSLSPTSSQAKRSLRDTIMIRRRERSLPLLKLILSASETSTSHLPVLRAKGSCDTLGHIRSNSLRHALTDLRFMLRVQIRTTGVGSEGMPGMHN